MAKTRKRDWGKRGEEDSWGRGGGGDMNAHPRHATCTRVQTRTCTHAWRPHTYVEEGRRMDEKRVGTQIYKYLHTYLHRSTHRRTHRV